MSQQEHKLLFSEAQIPLRIEENDDENCNYEQQDSEEDTQLIISDRERNNQIDNNQSNLLRQAKIESGSNGGTSYLDVMRNSQNSKTKLHKSLD